VAAANINGLDLYIPPDFQFGITNKTPEYLFKFPLGKIPSLETVSGFKLTEATAIASFVAESGPKRIQLLGSSVEERALIQKWISFAEAHVYPTQGLLVGPRLGMAVFDAKVEEESHAEFVKWLNHIENHLKGRKWLVSDQLGGPSLADLTLGGTLAMGFKFYIDAEMRKEFPELTGWFERLIAVPEVNEGFGHPFLAETRPAPKAV
jgi:elongation factor 1-gamma